MLVAASDAALTNIVLMKPETRGVKLALDHERLHFFSNLADCCYIELDNVDVPLDEWGRKQLKDL